jgi:DNA-binding NarL/FixJ family response regulator
MRKKNNDNRHRVYELTMQGYTEQEIADALCVAYKTVKYHKGNICKEYNAKNSHILIINYYKSIIAGLNKQNQKLTEKLDKLEAIGLDLPIGKAV